VSRGIKKICFWVVVALIFAIQIYPIVWLIIASFRTNSELATNPFGSLEHLTIENYVDVIQNSNVFIYLKNSAFVTCVALVFVVMFSSMAAFAISRIRFKTKNLLFAYFIMGLTIPPFVTLIPLYVMFSKMGLLDTHMALILVYIAFNLSISILLFVNFYKYIPEELSEAAILDGCSVYGIYFRIFVPLSKNTILTVLSMSFIGVWNDYLFSLLFINSTSLKTVSLGMQDFISETGYRVWGSTFATICITTVPTLIIYFALNKKVSSGMTLGATKG